MNCLKRRKRGRVPYTYLNNIYAKLSKFCDLGILLRKRYLNNTSLIEPLCSKIVLNFGLPRPFAVSYS